MFAKIGKKAVESTDEIGKSTDDFGIRQSICHYSMSMQLHTAYALSI